MKIIRKISSKALNKTIYWLTRLSSFYRLWKTRQALLPKILNKHVFVLGSGPKPDLRLLRDDSVLICVNGSAASAAKLGLKNPSLTIIDFELVDPNVNTSKPTRSVIIENKLLDGLQLGVLLMSQSNGSKGGSAHCLNGKFFMSLKLYKPDCCHIVFSATGSNVLESSYNGLLSRGAFAIATCAWLGAQSISFSGFSIFKSPSRQSFEPHFYGDLDVDFGGSLGIFASDSAEVFGKEWDLRNHSMADMAMIALLRMKGFDIKCTHKDFAPVLHNWGVSPSRQ